MYSAKIGGVLSYARGGYVGDHLSTTMIESEAMARAAEFSMELPDAVAEPARELKQIDTSKFIGKGRDTVNVDITVDSDDARFDPDDKDFGNMIRKHIEDSIRYAKGGTLIQKDSEGNITVHDKNGHMRVRMGALNDPEPIERKQEDPSPLGVYRPNLEDRKVGKVPMHMVIDGFPRALSHVAEIMDWAARVKGYKLHDWRNLPDADVAFPSAGYRHMTDNSRMKSDGLKALDRTDHESHKLHIGHQIFNLLAELELVLNGKISE